MDVVFEILKITIPAVIVFFATYYIVKNFLDNDQARRDSENRRQTHNTTLPLRLQAYERLIIFLERINPNLLVIRVNKAGFNAHQLHMELVKTIRTEFEHNLSQQIYVSYASWELVKNSKEEMLKLINITATKVAHDAPGNDLAMMILNVAGNIGKELPTDVAIKFIKKEVSQIF